MRIPRIIAITFALLAAMAASAQTTSVALNIGPAGAFCGVYNSASHYCYGLPVVAVTDGVTQYGSLWTDNQAASLGGGRKGFVDFFSVPVGDAVIESTSVSTDGGFVEELSGPGYTGTLTLYFTTKYVCSNNRFCHTTWTALPTSTLVIEWQTAAAPQVTSPIAPTPTCYPTTGNKCPAPPDQSGY